MPASRPTVRRQYGARKAAGESATPSKPTYLTRPPTRRLPRTHIRSCSARSPTPTHRTSATSSSTYGSSPPRKKSRLLSSAGDDWTAAVAETFSSPMMSEDEESGEGKTRRTGEDSTPPTTPVTAEKAEGGRFLRERKTPTKPPAPKGDLRSFFKRTSPRKRQRLSSPTNEGDAASTMSRSDSAGSSSSSSSTSSSRTALTSISSTSSSSSGKPAKYEQLYLDPFHTTGHATLSCTTCALSYARTPEDMAFHAKHHKKVVSGCDWIAGDDAKGCTVVEEAVDWGEKHGGKVVMVDYPLADAVIKRKLKDILETVDTELSSTSLTPDQLAQSKIFLFVTPQRKIIACAVVQRIKVAYQIVSTEAKDDAGDDKKDLLRFGEDQGAIFCSPTPSPTLLGVQRIWTSTSARRHGLASLLLDHVAAKYIYGSPIPRERRVEDFAFSQPTGKGQKLARAWTGSDRFKVFVD